MADTFLPKTLSVELRLQVAELDIRTQFRILPGKVCALVGRVDGGQSSVLKATAGLIQAQGGRIAIGQQVVYDSAAQINLPPEKRRLAWLDRAGHLMPHRTVKQHLTQAIQWGRRPHSGDHSLDAIAAWLDLTPLLAHQPAHLTATQRCRVGLARALLSQPEALLLDDVLTDIPESERESLLDLLAELPTRFKVPVAWVSPRMNEVIRMADDVLILHEGRMASAGPATQILSDVSLSTFLEGPQAGNVLDAEVKRHDIEWLLSEVDVAGQRITIPAAIHSIGQKVRLKIRARDINLHREPLVDCTVSNQVRGRITQIMLAGEHGTYGAVNIELDRPQNQLHQQTTGPTTMWAMMTRKSIQQMDWTPGQPCIASFKAMAVVVSAWR